MYCAEDVEYPEFLVTRDIQRTRKSHLCKECRRKIEVGSSALAVSGKWKGEFSSFYICSQCEKLAQVVSAHETDLVSCYGELYQALYDLDLIWDEDQIEEEAEKLLSKYPDKGVVRGRNCVIATHVPWLAKVNGYWQVVSESVFSNL